VEWGAAILKIGLGVVLAVPLAIYLMQDGLIFHPQPVPDAQRSHIEKRFADVQSLFIRAADGTMLHAWHVRGAAGAPLVLYFGGNAEEVSWMLARVRERAPGTGWLLVDYRGYGASDGSPSESALVADALRWHEHAKTQLGAQKIYLFGRSLGSAVAVQVAATHPPAGVILVTPYDSVTKVAKRYYPYLPVSLMLKHPFDSEARAPSIAAPLLCLVAERDEVIPAEHSKRLFDAWKGPKRWVGLAGAGHNSTDDVPAFWPAIKEFLAKPD
jgi:uncharacterized protein